jgi:hypothetical protein
MSGPVATNNFPGLSEPWVTSDSYASWRPATYCWKAPLSDGESIASQSHQLASHRRCAGYVTSWSQC